MQKNIEKKKTPNIIKKKKKKKKKERKRKKISSRICNIWNARPLSHGDIVVSEARLDGLTILTRRLLSHRGRTNGMSDVQALVVRFDMKNQLKPVISPILSISMRFV